MDWKTIEQIYLELLSTVYAQPEDEGHNAGCKAFVDWIMLNTKGINSVLDVGCGEGIAEPFFWKRNIKYGGIAWGIDVQHAQEKGRNVIEMDFNFIHGIAPATLVFSRHSLEHSPFPHITLKHWLNFTERYIAICVPALEWYKAGVKGTNHFSVLNERQWEALFTWADLNVIAKDVKFHPGSPDHAQQSIFEQTAEEYWYILEKQNGTA